MYDRITGALPGDLKLSNLLLLTILFKDDGSVARKSLLIRTRDDAGIDFLPHIFTAFENRFGIELPQTDFFFPSDYRCLGDDSANSIAESLFETVLETHTGDNSKHWFLVIGNPMIAGCILDLLDIDHSENED